MGMLRYERQSRIAPLPGATVAAPGGADAYGAGLGQAVEGAGKAALEVITKFEDSDVLNAYNNFKRDLEGYYYNPKTGVYNTLKGRDAVKLPDKARAEMEKMAAAYSKEMRNGRMKAVFYRMAGGLVDNMTRENVRYADAEIRGYEISQIMQLQEDGYKDIARHYMDDEAVRLIAENIGMTVYEQTRIEGWDLEKHSQEMARVDSNIMAIRIREMMKHDLHGAREFYANSGSILLEGEKPKIEKELKLYEAYSLALKAVEKEMDSSQAAVWIKESANDDETEGMASTMYDELVSQNNLKKSQERARQQKEQSDNNETMVGDYKAGHQWTNAKIQQEFSAGKLSISQAAAGYNRNNATSSYTEAYSRLEATITDWKTLSENEQDRLLMQDAGIGEADSEAAIRFFDQGIGTYLSEDMVKEFYERRLITREAAARYFKVLSSWDTNNDVALNEIREHFDKSMNPQSGEGALYGLYSEPEYAAKKAELNAYISELAAKGDADIVQKAEKKSRQFKSELLEKFLFKFIFKPRKPELTLKPIGVFKGEPFDFSDYDKKKEIYEKMKEVNTTFKLLAGSFDANKNSTFDQTDASRKGTAIKDGRLLVEQDSGVPFMLPDIVSGNLKIESTSSREDNKKNDGKTHVVLKGNDRRGNRVEWEITGIAKTNPFLRPGDVVTRNGFVGTVGRNNGSYDTAMGDKGLVEITLKVNGKTKDIAQYCSEIGYELPQQKNTKPEKKRSTAAGSSSRFADDDSLVNFFMGRQV